MGPRLFGALSVTTKADHDVVVVAPESVSTVVEANAPTDSDEGSTVAARMPAIIFLERFAFCPPVNFF